MLAANGLGTKMDPRSKMAAVHGAAEVFEPVLAKAFKLLHSKHPDSLEQLRSLRDDVFKQQHHTLIAPVDKPKEIKPLPRIDRKAVTITAQTTAQESKPGTKRKEPKVETQTVMSSGKAETSHRLPSVSEGALDLEAALEAVEELSSSSLMEGSAKRPKIQISVDSMLDEEGLKSHDSTPVEDLAIVLGGTVCVVCSREESKMPGNRLVECSECHSHYHQRCHETRVSDQDANDPRVVWYCSPCVKKMKEMTTSPTAKSRPVESAGPSKHRLPPLQPFRKSSISEGKSFPSPSTQQSFVIPALSGSSSSSSSGAGKSTATGAPSQNIAMQSAMKRLQMVKKKAQQKILNHQQIRIPRR